ncbi:MAG: dienelactone hydrolase family protein [Myxococcota bacterium]|nr:dienelactone hydrolase family protein [Myxococcota bacterium]
MTIETERVQISSDGGQFGGYVARPEGDESLPAVIVYMEIFGVNSHIRDVTERVAAEGYVAIAPDYFHRTGPGAELDYDDAGMAAGMKLLGGLKADEMVADAEATIGYLRGRSDVRGDRIGAIGFCIGGHMTYLTACTTDIQVSAPFYGGGIAAPQGPGGAVSTVSRTPGIKGAIVCFFGGQDAMIPPDQVDAVRGAISDAGVRGEVVVYDDADHGFHCDRRDSYDAAASKDAWQRVTDLFAAELKG